jgi:acetolactate synthase-1/2/3 large subunit
MDPHLARRVREADVLLVVGSRLEEITTGGYDLIEPPRPRQTLVHVHQDPEELGRVFAPDLAILSGLAEFGAAARELPPPAAPPWAEWTAAARADYEQNRRHEPRGGELVDLGAVAAQLPEDAIVTNGAGNYAGFAHRYHRFRRYPSQVAPGSGAMGYGLPAAIAARCVDAERPVVCFTGDGDFLMTGQELATAVQYELPLVVLVSNNGMYGTIRMHQERAYPGRVSATDLRNPDFAAYARAFGAHGETVERQEDFAAAFARALAAGGPAVLDLHVDPEAITTRATLTELRETSLHQG